MGKLIEMRPRYIRLINWLGLLDWTIVPVMISFHILTVAGLLWVRLRLATFLHAVVYAYMTGGFPLTAGIVLFILLKTWQDS